jgi:hypothetical protein
MSLIVSTSQEGRYKAEVVLHEANGYRSRDKGVIASGAGVLKPGTVLGKITLGAASAAAVAGNSGNGTMGAITVGAGAKPGVYKLVFVEPATDAGAFIVEDPDGIVIGSGDVAAAFSAGGLGFTLADGSNDFAAGDAFNITVAAGSGEYVPVDAAADDGSHEAVAVLYGANEQGSIDATSASVEVVLLVRDAELNGNHLEWAVSQSSGQKAVHLASLAERGLIVR